MKNLSPTAIVFGFWMTFGILLTNALRRLTNLVGNAFGSGWTVFSNSGEGIGSFYFFVAVVAALTSTAILAVCWRVARKGIGRRFRGVESLLKSGRMVTGIVIVALGAIVLSDWIQVQLSHAVIVRQSQRGVVGMLVWQPLVWNLPDALLALFVLLFHRRVLRDRSDRGAEVVDPFAKLEQFRAELADTWGLSSDEIRELQAHVLESSSELQARGHTEDQAVTLAIQQLGKAELLAGEFQKLHPERVWAPRIIAILSGLLLISGIGCVSVWVGWGVQLIANSWLQDVGGLSSGIWGNILPQVWMVFFSGCVGALTWLGVKEVAGKAFPAEDSSAGSGPVFPSWNHLWLVWLPALLGLVHVVGSMLAFQTSPQIHRLMLLGVGSTQMVSQVLWPAALAGVLLALMRPRQRLNSEKVS